MFSEIEQQYYSSADLVFLFYHGLKESVVEVIAKVEKIVEIKPEALIYLLRNVDISSEKASPRQGRIISRDFDAKDPSRGLDILKEAVKHCLQRSENDIEVTVLPLQRKGCSLL